MDDQLARRALPPFDRLPVELRIRIFGLVLCKRAGRKHLIRRRTYPGGPPYHRITDTALLVALASDHHYGEACEILYAEHFFELNTYRQLKELTDGCASGMYITRLELINLASAAVFITNHRLSVAARLLKLKLLVVAFDGLPHTTTLREHLDSIGWIPARKLVCVLVGLYKVCLGSSRVVYFTHIGIRQKWRLSKLQYAKSKGQRDVWKIVSPKEDAQNLWPYEWFAAFDALTWFKARSRVDNMHDEDQTQFLEKYERGLVTRRSTDSVIAAMTGKVSFLVLALDQPESRTAEVLEGMTDLLHINCGCCPGLGEGNGTYFVEQRRHKRMIGNLTKSTAETVDDPESNTATCEQASHGRTWAKAALGVIKNAARRVFCCG
ncbi:hypothetical protein LTR17_002647 [Elasticomyces elasticus]|nr:hypothetical protein LTR17_002647 [Elasticomyces elasticus]